MTVIIGSARHDEHGACYSGGKAGDQLQGGTNDRSGEVSQQTFYVHSKGWYVLRPKDATQATKLASAMVRACDNAHIGYDQSNRLGIIKHGTKTTVDTECDCSSLVRQCIIEACGKDVGNFTTSNEASTLESSGLFQSRISYTASTTLCTGDVLVTKSSGHTVIVTSGKERTNTNTNDDGGFDVADLDTIKNGSKGAQVESLQALLNVKNNAGIKIDGKAGSKTEKAIRSYQTAKGLTVDGECGKATWKKILTT